MCSGGNFLLPFFLVDLIIKVQRIRNVDGFSNFIHTKIKLFVVFSADLLYGVFILIRCRMYMKYFRSTQSRDFCVLGSSRSESLTCEHISTMSFPKKPGGKALDALQNLPRITLANLRPEPGSKKAASWTFLSVHIEILANVAWQLAALLSYAN